MITPELINRFPRCKLLVTGAAGQLGTITLKSFSNLPGVHIRAVYHKQQPTVFADNIEYVQADLKNPESCREITKDIDIAFMFAGRVLTSPVIARDPVSPVTEMMILNAQVLEAAYLAGVKKLLWVSSSTGYPRTERTLKEEDMFDGDPADIYFSLGWMSRYTEILCRMYATKLKNPMTIVILRPTTIYSEYEDFNYESSHVLPALVRRVVERQKPIEVWGTGENKRDLIYASDVIDAGLMVLERVDTFDVFNIGYGKYYSVGEILQMILEIDNYLEAEITHDTSKPDTVKTIYLDLAKSQKVLGFKAKTSLKEGISRMVESYRRNQLL